MAIQRVCVFCGSGEGTDTVYKEQAALLGKTLALQHIELVYGGAHIGVMGAVADGALSAGGRVTGVIPHFLADKELAHTGLTELILVETMHERKAMMNSRCDAVITLPGGYGTMEELFEMLTWAQLGLHNKPIGILNVNGYYDSLRMLTENMVAKGFLSAEHKDKLVISDNITELLQKLNDYHAPRAEAVITEATI